MMKTSPRPKPRPASLGKPTVRPKARPANLVEDSELAAMVARANRSADREGADLPENMKKKSGGKLKMVQQGGKKVPAFAADGVGKMANGGMCRGMGAATKGGKYKA